MSQPSLTSNLDFCCQVKSIEKNQLHLGTKNLNRNRESSTKSVFNQTSEIRRSNPEAKSVSENSSVLKYKFPSDNSTLPAYIFHLIKEP